MVEVEAVKSVEEIERIAALLLKHGNQDYTDIWKLGINVAFRLSDLLSLTYDDLDLNKCELTIIEAKTSKTRTVRLNNNALSIVKRRREASPLDYYLFQSKSNRGRSSGDPLNRSTVARKFKEIGDIIGLKLSTHSMRKTRGYMLYSNGVSIERICKVLNHSTPAVTMAYIGLDKESTLQTYTDLEL